MSYKKKSKGPSPSKQALIQLSNILKAAAEKGDPRFMFCGTVNQMLSVHYGLSEETETKTFNQWKLSGYMVKKGEKAYKFWSKPKQGFKKKEQDLDFDPSEDEEDKDEYKFFGIANVFSIDQVEKMQPKTQQ